MTRLLYTIGIIVGSILGSWIAGLFGFGFLTGWSILANTLGALLGLFVAYKINSYLNF